MPSWKLFLIGLIAPVLVMSMFAITMATTDLHRLSQHTFSRRCIPGAARAYCRDQAGY